MLASNEPLDIKIQPDGSIRAVPKGTANNAEVKPITAKYAVATCKHIIAFADEKHAKPCPVCELEQVKIKLCHLHGNVTDIKVTLGGIIEDSKRALERCDVFTTRIREIQEAHGHLRPPNAEVSDQRGAGSLH